MKAWSLGNTTIRSPFRLRDGLRVLVESPLHGNLLGKEQQQRFARLLFEKQIVSATRFQADGELDASDLGRKWHGALVKMGFVTPKLSRVADSHGVDPKLAEMVAGLPGLTGRPFEVTPHGQRLLDTESLAAQQEIFLRSLVAIQMPSPIEKLFAGKSVFNPLRIVLAILVGLKQRNQEASLSFEEMRYIVQFTTNISDVPETVNEITAFRQQRMRAANKAVFDGARASDMEPLLEGQSLSTTLDYADTNLRYLKATGLFLAKGRGIMVSPPRESLVQQLLATPFVPLDDVNSLRKLWIGAPLPTDQAAQALEAIEAVANALQASGEVVDTSTFRTLGLQDMRQTLHELNDRYERALERQYAIKQRTEWRDIVAYLEKLQHLRARGGPIIPRDQAPEYLEWAVWRAFLAINSLINLPWEARRFRFSAIEEAPISTAPGGGPDMLFEFSDYILVVEVTLTTGSNQEAAEGEPVRRHVAKVVDMLATSGQEKSVIGLFVANGINTNTADTFQRRRWFEQGDREIVIDIVPLTLAQFGSLFEAGFGRSTGLSPATLRDILATCLEDIQTSPMKWKEHIEACVASAVRKLTADAQ